MFSKYLSCLVKKKRYNKLLKRVKIIIMAFFVCGFVMANDDDDDGDILVGYWVINGKQ